MLYNEVTWSLNTLVVVRVDTDFVSLQLEGIFTVFQGPQFMVGLQVRPPP